MENINSMPSWEMDIQADQGIFPHGEKVQSQDDTEAAIQPFDNGETSTCDPDIILDEIYVYPHIFPHRASKGYTHRQQKGFPCPSREDDITSASFFHEPD